MRTGFVIAILLSGCLLGAQETSSKSQEKEAALGRHAAETFSSRTVNDGAVQSFLNRLSRRLAAQVRDADFPFTVKAISDDPCRTTHEPVALPAGYIFVPAALFLAAEDEAEFAGMLAQVMERIVLRQGLRRVAQMDTLAPIPLIFVGNGCSEMIPVSQGKMEMQADGLAVEALAHAGFDPDALLRYLERAQPNRPERAENIRSVLQLQPQANYIVDESEFDAVRQRVRFLTEWPAQVRKMPTLGPQ